MARCCTADRDEMSLLHSAVMQALLKLRRCSVNPPSQVAEETLEADIWFRASILLFAE